MPHYQILRDHPVNDERREAGQKPANCLWLWGEGRADSVAESVGTISDVSVWWSPQSDVHRGLGLLAGLEAVDRRSHWPIFVRMRRWRWRN